MAETDEILLEAFAKTLRKKRNALGLSQEELAHRAGVSMRYISLLESSQHQPSLSTLRGLCVGLGISMTGFMSELEDTLPA